MPQAIPAVCVRRTSISVQLLPFGLSLSPRVFTKVAEAALVPLREQGVRILNYLDDWLILAQSQDQLCEHRDWCTRTSASWAFGSTGKRANSCRCRGSFFSVWSSDSVNQTARLTQERAQSVLNCLNTFKNRRPGRPVRVPRDVALPVVLLPDRRNTRHRRTGTQLARGTILAYQDSVLRADAPRDSPSLADSSEEGSTDSETGHLMAPASRPLETCLVPRRDAEVLGDLPQEVVDTITSARAPSTRHAYALKRNLFVEWCSSHREDPRRCPIRVVLSFLQQGLERRLSPSTLKVYMAAIAANHDTVEGKSVGKHDWVVRFLRGARRLNPPRPPLYTLLGPVLSA